MTSDVKLMPNENQTATATVHRAFILQADMSHIYRQFHLVEQSSQPASRFQ